jgi:DNA repair photolyase
MPYSLTPVLPFPDPIDRPARLKIQRVKRRTPILTPSANNPGVFGIDLTAGCLHACPYCFIRGSAKYPGEGQVLFDPFTAENLSQVFGTLRELPKQIVLSPTSDPLPLEREVRAEGIRTINLLLQRGINVLVMTRGFVPRSLIRLMAQYPDRARVELAIMTADRRLSRLLEPGAASPIARLRALQRLSDAKVPVTVRFEPLIAGLTDTRENVEPLFEELARRGAQRVITHYLFLHNAMIARLKSALAPLGWSERLTDSYESGPVFHFGSVGPTKNLPIEIRAQGLAKVKAWGAEWGLLVETGATQNPDFPRPDVVGGPVTGPRPARQAR